jgi:predicted esterase
MVARAQERPPGASCPRALRPSSTWAMLFAMLVMISSRRVSPLVTDASAVGGQASCGARVHGSMHPALSLRGGADDKLAPEAFADARTSGLRAGSMLSRSADLARRTWIASRSASEAVRQLQGDGEHAKAEAPVNASLHGESHENEVMEDERGSGWAGVAAGPRLKCTVVEPSEKHTATIIWLHGRGHEPDDLIAGDLPKALAVPWCKFCLVHSPKGRGTNGGMDMLGKESGEDEEGWGKSDRGGRWLPTGQSPITEMDSLLRLVNGVHRLIRQETSGEKGVPSQRIVLAGHGEGGVVALAAALSCRQVRSSVNLSMEHGESGH